MELHILNKPAYAKHRDYHLINEWQPVWSQITQQFNSRQQSYATVHSRE